MNESNLHDYQITAVNHLLKHTHSGLLLDMGLGKTISVLTAINKLMYEELDILKVLIIGTKRVAENVWTTEIQNWEHTKHMRISVIAGNEKRRKAAIKKEADIYTIGRDNIAWLCGLYGGSMLPFDMLVVDESSSFKNPKAIRFKALRAVQPSFKRVTILTGTPDPNGIIDIWSQIYLLDRGQRLSRFITRFREEYFEPGKTNGHIVYSYNPKKDGEERIYSKISDICISMKSEDHLKLPGRVNNYIDINFPPRLQKKYDDFEKEKILEIFEGHKKGDIISTANAAALSTKLLQFANGAIYDEDKDFHEVHDLKLDAVEEIIEAAQGKPVLIAWSFRHDAERLKKRLAKYSPRELKKNQDISDWNSGKIQVLLMHPASGGHGLNLQAGGNMIIWFGQTWAAELYQQLNARLDRQGQKEVVIVNHLVSSKTIDEDVIKALSRKIKGQDRLMEALKAKIDKYINT